MRRIYLLLVFIFALFGWIVFAATSPQPKSVKFQPVWKKGDKQSILYRLEATASASMPLMPNHMPVTLYSKIEREMEQKILDVKDNRPAKLERLYLSSKYYISKESVKPKEDGLHNKTLLIENTGGITATGWVKKPTEPNPPKPDVPPAMKETISIDECNFGLFLPDKEVKVGDEWQVTEEKTLRVFNFANPRKRATIHGCTEIGINAKFTSGKFTCKLSEVKTEKGEEYAIIIVTGTLAGNDSGINLEIALSGKATYFTKKNKFQKLEFEGTVKGEGDQPCSVKIAVSSKTIVEGSLKLNVEFK